MARERARASESEGESKSERDSRVVVAAAECCIACESQSHPTSLDSGEHDAGPISRVAACRGAPEAPPGEPKPKLLSSRLISVAFCKN